MLRNPLLRLLLLGQLLLCSCHMLNKPDKNPAGDGNRQVFTPADSLAVKPAVDLYQCLHRISGRGTMIGHQDALAYGMGWKGDEFRADIHDVCGDFPAVFGWDLGHIGDSSNIDGVPFDRMQQWAIQVHERGGINTCSWHMRNIVSGTNAWDITPCVTAILPGGDRHGAFLEKLDHVAAFFASLETPEGEAVPVVFRPFHEMNGGWFWWGTNSCTPEEYKSLYRFTADYLRNTKHLHHLLYAFSPDVFNSAGEYLTFYPGDEYVDILGLDDYGGLAAREDTPRTIRMLEMLDSIASERSKVMAITETGLEALPDPLWFTEVVLPTLTANASTRKACWILFWRNGRPDHFYAPYPGHESAADFIKFKEDPVTWFLSDVPKSCKSPDEE